MKALYTVWKNSNDQVMIVDGTLEETARALGISTGSVYSLASRCRKGIIKKWAFEVRYVRKRGPRKGSHYGKRKKK